MADGKVLWRKCVECGDWIDEDEVVWVEEGRIVDIHGNIDLDEAPLAVDGEERQPYCVPCILRLRRDA